MRLAMARMSLARDGRVAAHIIAACASGIRSSKAVLSLHAQSSPPLYSPNENVPRDAWFTCGPCPSLAREASRREAAGPGQCAPAALLAPHEESERPPALLLHSFFGLAA